MNSVLLDSASWGLILSVLSPLLISVVQQPQWTSQVRAFVTVACALVIGFITVLANGGLDLSGGQATQTVLSIAALVFVASSQWYRSVWKTTGLARVIEMKTATRAGKAYVARHRRDDNAA